MYRDNKSSRTRAVPMVERDACWIDHCRCSVPRSSPAYDGQITTRWTRPLIESRARVPRGFRSSPNKWFRVAYYKSTRGR